MTTAVWGLMLEFATPSELLAATRAVNQAGYRRMDAYTPYHVEGLAAELADCFQNQGTTIKKKDDTHRMAEANRAFAHYKW